VLSTLLQFTRSGERNLLGCRNFGEQAWLARGDRYEGPMRMWDSEPEVAQ
jgi:hypothetical protein